jgi:hypothetical protein
VRNCFSLPKSSFRLDRTTRLVFSRIRLLLSDIPKAVWEQRVEDFMLLSIGSLCERACKVAARDRPVGRNPALFTANLISFGTAGLCAPTKSRPQKKNGAPRIS